MAFEIAKSGWVQRLSSFLRRWKRNWLVLYQDGSLKYFESPDSHTAEEAHNLPRNCFAIYTAEQVVGDPPAGFGRTCLFSLALRNDTTLTFCAEGPDDMRAWEMALEEAMMLNRHAPSAPPFAPAGGNPGQVVAYTGPDGEVYYRPHPPPYDLPPGQGAVVYTDDPYYYERYPGRYRRRCYHDGDLAFGLVGGMALGSLMWGPLLWW